MTPWTIPSMEFSRPEYWSGWPFLSPGNLPNPVIKPRSPALQVDSLPAEPQGKPRKKKMARLKKKNKTHLHSQKSTNATHEVKLQSGRRDLQQRKLTGGDEESCVSMWKKTIQRKTGQEVPGIHRKGNQTAHQYEKARPHQQCGNSQPQGGIISHLD